MFWLGLLISILITAPVWMLLTQGNLELIRSLLTEAGIQKAFLNTVLMGGMVALVGVILGVFFGWLTARFQWRGRGIMRFGICLPYLVPNFVWAIGYSLCWNPQSGVFNRLFGLHVDCYGFWGMTLVMILTHFQVAFLIFESKFLSFDSSLEEAARISGCSAGKTFLTVVLPRLYVPLATSYVLLFTLSLSAFGIPSWLGVPGRVHVLTTKLYERLQASGVEGLGEAASLGSILAFIGLVLLAFEFGLNQKFKVSELAGKGARISLTFLNRWNALGLNAALSFLFGIFWVGPLFVIFLITIMPPGFLSDPQWSFEQVSFQKYFYVINDLQDTRQALVGSFGYGALGVVCILVLSGLLLFASKRSSAAQKVAESSMSIPLASAGVVIALGLIMLAGGQFGFVLTNTPWILVAAFVIKHLALAYRPLQIALNSISQSYLEAARLSGCSTWGTFAKILFPMLLPTIVAAGLLVYIPILGELSMSIFLVGPNAKTIGSVLYELHDYADQASAMVLAFILVMAVVVLNGMMRVVTKGKLGF